MEILIGLMPIIFMLVWAFMFLLIIGSIVFWIIMLIDCVGRDDKDFPNPSQNTKLIWILVLILGGQIGAIIYYFVVKRAAPTNLAPK